MSDLHSQLHDYVESTIDRVDVEDVVNAASTGQIADPRPVRRLRPVWVVAGAALLVMLLVGVPLLLLGDGDSTTAEQVTATTVSVTSTAPPTTQTASTTTTAPPTTELLTPPPWSAILATTTAGTAPPAATCPPGTNPNVPGSVDQERPGLGPWNNQSAVFDQHTGRIVFVDETGETWTFDVCTNAWQAMNPRFAPSASDRLWEGELVYDIDSDRTIAFGRRQVFVYDANTNTWRQRATPKDVDLGWNPPGLGAVYDPVSGLVLVVTGDGGLTAYDVDTDVWTTIGIITEQREVTSEGQTQTLGPPFMIGYVAEADRLAFLGFTGAPFQAEGGLVNPRTGESIDLEQPPGSVVGGFGTFTYATSGDTAHVLNDPITQTSRQICELDPTTFEWSCSSQPPPGVPDIRQVPSAMVVDSINNRLVIINDWSGVWPGSTTTNTVWGIDLDTEESIELLAANDQTYHD